MGKAKAKQPKLPPEALEYFREVGRVGGLKGGSAGGRKSAANMTPEQRHERARRAALQSAKVRRRQRKGR